MELTVVLMIIAVTATLIVPQTLGSMTSARLRESGQGLLVAARYAHDFATTRRRVCRLVVDARNHTHHLEYQSDPQGKPFEFTSMTGGPIKSTRLGKGVEFTLVRIDSSRRTQFEGEDSGDVITFEPTGGADAAVVQISDGRRTHSLLIEQGSGRAKLVGRAVDQPPNDRGDLDE